MTSPPNTVKLPAQQASEDEVRQNRITELSNRLNKAIRNKYYFEAVFIEYAIIDDLCERALILANAYNSTKHDTLGRRLRRLINLQKNPKSLCHKKYNEKNLLAIFNWKENRNIITYELIKHDFSTDELEKLVKEGKKLIPILKRSVTNYAKAITPQKII